MSEKEQDPQSWVTPVCRLGGSSLFEKSKPPHTDDSQLSFNAELLFVKGEDLSAGKDAVKAAIRDEWGDTPPKNLKSPFRDQGDKDHRNGFEEGAIFISPNSKKYRPGIVGPRKDPATGKLEVIDDETEIYSGCWVRASLRAKAYGGGSSGISPGVKFYLQNLQKVRDGEPLGGRVNPESDFEAVDDEDGGVDDLLDLD